MRLNRARAGRAQAADFVLGLRLLKLLRWPVPNSMPKSRDTAFLAACALAAHASLAAAADPLANIRRCAAESDAAQRLACYDKQFRLLDAQAPTQPKSAAAEPAPVPAATAEQRFGMNGQVERSEPTTQPPKIAKLTSRISAVGYKPHGEAIVKLENGQVWEEADGEEPVNLKIGAEVTIDTGVMGAYWLRYGKHASVRVKRTR
jgi:hypothetical protein